MTIFLCDLLSLHSWWQSTVSILKDRSFHRLWLLKARLLSVRTVALRIRLKRACQTNLHLAKRWMNGQNVQGCPALVQAANADQLFGQTRRCKQQRLCINAGMIGMHTCLFYCRTGRWDGCDQLPKTHPVQTVLDISPCKLMASHPRLATL